MSLWGTFANGIGVALQDALAAMKGGASVAQSAGVSSFRLAGQTVSITALIAQLDQLSKADIPGAIRATHFASLKDFLLSQQFPQDLVDIADLVGIIGLAFPPAAVAANDIRMIAMILTVSHSLIAGVLTLDQLFGIHPESVPGANPTYDGIFPSTNSPASRTNNGWPTVIQP